MYRLHVYRFRNEVQNYAHGSCVFMYSRIASEPRIHSDTAGKWPQRQHRQGCYDATQCFRFSAFEHQD